MNFLVKGILLIYGSDIDLYRRRQLCFPARVIFLKAKEFLLQDCAYFFGLGSQGTWDLQSFKSFAHRVSIFSELLFTLLGQKKRERETKTERERDMWDLGIRHTNSFM